MPRVLQSMVVDELTCLLAFHILITPKVRSIVDLNFLVEYTTLEGHENNGGRESAVIGSLVLFTGAIGSPLLNKAAMSSNSVVQGNY